MSEPRISRVASSTEIDQTKHLQRAMWAAGDYHRFALRTVWQLGPILVRACGVGAGHRVLDVAAGTGNIAIRAAATGARVVATDLTPENLEAGRHAAEQHGVQIEWREADAECLPFGSDEFDVVTSAFGAVFAPDHRKVASELLRVCRPGGTIGMINFTPDSLAADFSRLLARHARAPMGEARSALSWGTEIHLRELFADKVDFVEMTRGEYVERAARPEEYLGFLKETFPPVVSVYQSMVGQLEHVAALDRDLLNLVMSANCGVPGGDAQYRFEYLLFVGRKRDSS